MNYKYKGYCFDEEGFHTEPIFLEDEESALRYLMLQRIVQHKVQIVDGDDFIVMETKDGKGVFPPELVNLINRIDKQNEPSAKSSY